MSIQILTDYFLQYGAFFIFLIVLLEYLNLPGFPAGVIMPLSGIWASQRRNSFWCCTDSDRSGRTDRKLAFVFNRAPRRKDRAGLVLPQISNAGAAHPGKNGNASEKGCIGVFISKLLPVAPHFDFHSCWHDPDEFLDLHRQFFFRGSGLESGICRCRILSR